MKKLPSVLITHENIQKFKTFAALKHVLIFTITKVMFPSIFFDALLGTKQLIVGWQSH